MINFTDKWNKALMIENYSLSQIPTDDCRLYDEVVSLIPSLAKDILDVGAGSGYIVRELNKKGFNAIGTTICKEDSETYGLINGDMHDLQWEDESFDVVIARHVLEHALSPRLAIREMHRVLRDKGLLIVGTPYNIEGVEDGDNISHFYCFTPVQWISFVQLNGFDTLEYHYPFPYFRIIAQKK